MQFMKGPVIERIRNARLRSLDTRSFPHTQALRGTHKAAHLYA